MPKSKDQKILELEQKTQLLEKQAENSDKKAVFFDMLIDIAEKNLNISIRKKPLPEPLRFSKKTQKKQ